MLPLGFTRDNPNVIIPLNNKVDRAELDHLIRAVSAKRGLTEQEAEMMASVAEEQYEYRMKVKEASSELHRRIAEQARYPKLKYGGLKPPRRKSQRSTEVFHS